MSFGGTFSGRGPPGPRGVAGLPSDAVATGSGQTTSTAYVEILRYTTPSTAGHVYRLVVNSTDATTSDANAYVRRFAVARHASKTSGNARILGSIEATLTAEEQAPCDIAVSVDVHDIVCRAKGQSTHMINWTAALYLESST